MRAVRMTTGVRRRQARQTNVCPVYPRGLPPRPENQSQRRRPARIERDGGGARAVPPQESPESGFTWKLRFHFDRDVRAGQLRDGELLYWQAIPTRTPVSGRAGAKPLAAAATPQPQHAPCRGNSAGESEPGSCASEPPPEDHLYHGLDSAEESSGVAQRTGKGQPRERDRSAVEPAREQAARLTAEEEEPMKAEEEPTRLAVEVLTPCVLLRNPLDHHDYPQRKLCAMCRYRKTQWHCACRPPGGLGQHPPLYLCKRCGTQHIP